MAPKVSIGLRRLVGEVASFEMAGLHLVLLPLAGSYFHNEICFAGVCIGFADLNMASVLLAGLGG